MNELEQLNERIEQLTELVKTGSEAIKSMETALKAAEEERDRLVGQREEQIPKLKRRVGDVYYYTTDDKTDGVMRVGYGHDYYDELRYILWGIINECKKPHYDREDDLNSYYKICSIIKDANEYLEKGVERSCSYENDI